MNNPVSTDSITTDTALSRDFQAKFHKSFRWAFAGSIIYEATKTLHNFFLVKLLVPEQYGMIASCLAFTYFITKIADFGASTSLLPFFHLIIQSKQNFKNLILKHYLLPHIPLTLFTALATTLVLHQTKLPQINNNHLPILFLIALVVFFETLRSFLRLFMYTALQTKTVVILEVATFLGFVLSVWMPYLLLGQPLSFQSVFIPHIIESAITVIILSIFLINFYRKLPDNKLLLPSNITMRMLKTKFFNYLLRLSRELFSTHFLTPFFALRLGLEYAGVFYFSTVIAHSLQSILKISVGYMGNALFANLKQSSSNTKQQAFSMLCHKLSKFLLPITIFILINSNKLLKRATAADLNTMALTLPMLFLFILIVDFMMSLYEQLYIIEEAMPQFLSFKIFEFILFILLINVTNGKTPLPIFLIGIIGIKILSFGIISFSAFKSWKVKPTIKATLQQITIYVIASILLSIAL